MPIAEITKPPHQHNAATTPALRGPTRSSHPPQMAADEPKNTKNKVYIQPKVEMRQSQVVVNNSAKKLKFLHSTGFSIPMALDRGNQKTEKP